VDLPLLGFVLHGWGKLHIDNRELATDAALVALLNAGDAYRVEHLQCTGRLCAVTVALSPELVEEALADAGASRGRTPMRPFANRLIPRDSGSQLLLYRILAAGETSSADHLQSEELALELVRGVLRRANEWKVEAPSATSARLASAAREILVTRFKEPLTLEAIAAELGCTKYHLCRIFRTCTGTTVFAYLTQLRLAAALRRLAGGEEDLSQLAYELGFSSHSHFTFAFRAAFGRTPSETRRYLPLS
jgi:AraC-like DNA-binding protein